MTKLRLTLFEDGQEYTAEMTREPIALDEWTWNWLKGAFIGVGFNVESVKEFFEPDITKGGGK